METRTEKVSFRGSDGRELDGLLELPAREPVAWVLFAHCFTYGENPFAAMAISQTLAEHGLGVLRFDFTSPPDEGETSRTHLLSDVEDVVGAADYLRTTRCAPSLLLGHSLGGTAVLRAALGLPEVKAAAVLGAWAGRYVGASEVEEQRGARRELAEGVVEVREAGEGPFAQEIRVGRHRLRADEPLSFGGGDTGPSPYGLLGAALGACTAMTLRVYARNKGWPLEHVSVRLSHMKVHAEDCERCETKVGKVDRIDRTVTLEGPLSEAQRRKLLEMADRCPVHRSLESEIDVNTFLDEEESLSPNPG